MYKRIKENKNNIFDELNLHVLKQLLGKNKNHIETLKEIINKYLSKL